MVPKVGFEPTEGLLWVEGGHSNQCPFTALEWTERSGQREATSEKKATSSPGFGGTRSLYDDKRVGKPLILQALSPRGTGEKGLPLTRVWPTA